MTTAEFKNGPSLMGWALAVAAAVVAFGVGIVVGKLGFMPAAFIAALVALGVGLILGMPWGADEAGATFAPAAKAPEAAKSMAASQPLMAASADARVVAGGAGNATDGGAAGIVSGGAGNATGGDAGVASVSRVMADDSVADSAGSTASKAEANATPASFMAAPVADPAPAKAPKTKVANSVSDEKPAAKADAKPAAADKPAKAPKAKKEEGPARLKAPRKGKADDLKEIEGIGPALETLCNQLGFYHFDQIASWTDEDVAWVDQNMARFKGRITRDKWVAQAKIIVSEGLEAFRERAKTNNY